MELFQGTSNIKVNNNVEFSVESEKKYLIELVGDEMIIDINQVNNNTWWRFIYSKASLRF